MKKVLLPVLSILLLFCLFGCDNGQFAAGGGESKVTGSIAYFYASGETTIKAFNSEDTREKSVELSSGSSYTIGLRPSFRGSKQALYTDDPATFSFRDDCCEIDYIGIQNDHPTYKLTVKADSDFDLTITVDDYSQTIKIIVR